MKRLAALALLGLSLLPPVTAFAQDDAERLRIHGSNLLGARLVPDLVDAWLRSIEYTGIRHLRISRDREEIHAVRDGAALVVEIDKRGTASGFADLVAGDAEIAMTARQPNAAERDAAWQLGDLASPGQEWVLGLDGLAVLVAPGSTLREISVEQLRGVLAGRIRDGSELGSSPGTLRVHALAASTGPGELMQQMLLGAGRPAATVRLHATPAAVLAALRADPTAIGIVGLRTPRAGLRALAVRSGALAVAPERAPVGAEEYPLQRRVYFHTGQLITALGRGFVQYALSNAGQAVVERSPFLPLALRALPYAEGAGPADYLKLVNGARRVPMSVHFGKGIDLLDSRGRQDLERLALYLHRPENAQRRVVLVGFANPDRRSPYLSLSLSHERVDYVSSELLAMNVRVVSQRGFGGSRYLVADGAPGASYRNDRVEVWLR